MKIRSGFVSNSSSSSFICDTNKSPKTVKGQLVKIVELYNELSGENNKFSDIFDEPFVANKALYSVFKGYLRKDDIEKIIHDKKLIILSNGCNTVPDCFFDLIEEIYNSRFVHLG